MVDKTRKNKCLDQIGCTVLRGTIIPVQPSKPCELTELIILSSSNPIKFYLHRCSNNEYSLTCKKKESITEWNRLQINILIRYGKSLYSKIIFLFCIKQSLVYM